MKTEKLNYNLPSELIAQKPADKREQARLLVLKRASGELVDAFFGQITEYLRSGDCLVLNDTRVIPARFYARRKTGGKLEGLFLESVSRNRWKVYLKGLGKVKTGERILMLDKNGEKFCTAVLSEKTGEGQCVLEVESEEGFTGVLGRIGFAPLPPYIKRDNKDTGLSDYDKARYQTVFARKEGAVAAPTAGLHFTEKLLGESEQKGISTAFVTLHVGAGTFRPVKTENLEDHNIHNEWYSVDSENAEIINRTRQEGGRVIAVGTTSVRTLETVAEDGRVGADEGSTELFIQPGYNFKIVDGMITNFHLPRSTLLALVCAFAGMDNAMRAYRHAVEQKYRFYSYGDAMFII